MINLYNTDCMEFMANCEDNAYDLAIVDPPYGMGQSINFRYDKIYDNTEAPSLEYFKELYRISQNQIIWGANYFTYALEPSKAWLCWDKGQPLKNFSDFELAWTSFKKVGIKINLDSYGFNHADKRHGHGSTIHPTQKPVALYKWLLHNYAKEGDNIIDTHGGSGSILLDCHDYKYSIDWMEIDKEYFDAAKKRYENHIKQTKLEL